MHTSTHPSFSSSHTVGGTYVIQLSFKGKREAVAMDQWIWLLALQLMSLSYLLAFFLPSQQQKQYLSLTAVVWISRSLDQGFALHHAHVYDISNDFRPISEQANLRQSIFISGLTNMVFISLENKMSMVMCKQWKLYFNVADLFFALSNFQWHIFMSDHIICHTFFLVFSF